MFTYKLQSDGDYKALEPVDTAVMAKTATLYADQGNRTDIAIEGKEL